MKYNKEKLSTNPACFVINTQFEFLLAIANELAEYNRLTRVKLNRVYNASKEQFWRTWHE